MRARIAAAVAVIAVTCAGCGASAPSPSGLSGTITVFAGASLTAVYTTIATAFEKSHPGTTVTFTFSGSPTLVSQIQQGAIGDLFASAEHATLINAGLTAESPIVFARNDLEIVVGKGNPKQITSPADLARSGVEVVLCAPTPPCASSASTAATQSGSARKRPRSPFTRHSIAF